jgi:hypothetical protein
MSLTPCKGCGATIDSSAKACPKCGRASPAIGGGLKAMLFLAVVVAIGAVVYQCSAGIDRVRDGARSGERAR